MPRVYVSVGSNVERERHLRAGLADLREAFGVVQCSRVFESEAVGFDGAPFYNLVVAFDTELPVEAVDTQLSRIEESHGRIRGERRFAPRTLDLDLLLYGDRIVRRPGLTVPRDEITRYAFVLRPLAEIAGGERHPVDGRSFGELWAAFDRPDQALRPTKLKL